MITWITDKIAIGEVSDINLDSLVMQEIDCVLNLCIKPDPIPEYDFGVDFYHVAVGGRQGLNPILIELKTAGYMLNLLDQHYKKILVHCVAGIDRSPFVVAKYLVEHGHAKSIGEAYGIIKKKRPFIVEHYEWARKE